MDQKRVGVLNTKEIPTLGAKSLDEHITVDDLVEHIEAIYKLFNEYREDFGMCNVDFRGEDPEGRAIEYEQKFCELQCQLIGHIIRPDQDGPRSHGYCDRCQEQV